MCRSATLRAVSFDVERDKGAARGVSRAAPSGAAKGGVYESETAKL